MLDEKPASGEKLRNNRFFLPTVLLLAAAVVTVLLIAFKPEVVEEKNEIPSLVVEVQAARYEEAVRSSVFQGEVRAKTDIELVTQVTGNVIQVADKFVEGGQFEKGELILQIDDADYRVALKSAEAAVAEAKVQLDIELAAAETNRHEWQNLLGESLENANPLRLNQPQVQRAKARLAASQAQLAQAKLDFDRTRIRAPFAGRVMSKSAELGQFVSRGSAVARVFSTNSVEIRIPMSDLQIAELGLSPGLVANAQEAVPAQVSTRFGNDLHRWQGYLKSVDASVDNETRLLFATIVVEQPFAQNSGKLPLAPGLFVDVELSGAGKVAGVSVPRLALRSGNQIYLYKDETLRIKQVATLFTSDELAVLDSGKENAVVAGDLVIVSPVPGAYDGMSVKIKEPTTVDENNHDKTGA